MATSIFQLLAAKSQGRQVTLRRPLGAGRLNRPLTRFLPLTVGSLFLGRAEGQVGVEDLPFVKVVQEVVGHTACLRLGTVKRHFGRLGVGCRGAALLRRLLGTCDDRQHLGLHGAKPLR